MKNISWSIVVYTFLGVAALVGMAVLMSVVSKKDSEQVCQSLMVVVEGKETFIDQHDISRMMDDQFGSIVGKTLSTIQYHKIENAIERLSYVADAEIFTDINGVVKIIVKQREVVLRIMSTNGREYYIDRESKKVPVTLKYVPHVLVASGYIREGYERPLEKVESKMVKDLVKIAEHIRGDELWENQIVQVYVNSEHDIELVPRVGKEVLVIGSADSLDYKLDRLKAYYTNILPRVGGDAYARVNVKFADQIICERKGEWFIDSLQKKINMKN